MTATGRWKKKSLPLPSIQAAIPIAATTAAGSAVTAVPCAAQKRDEVLAILAAIIVIIVGVALSSLKDSIKRTIDYHRKPKKKKEPEPEDDATGAIVSGSEVSEKFMTYEWTLTRTTGVKTKTSAGVTPQTCPHCGAHVDVNQTAECPFCGSVITTDTFDWAIDNITALSQKTK